jgi:hypothetical protein
MPVVIISLMNFLAFGAILSSLLLLAAINFAFIFIYSNSIYRPKTLLHHTPEPVSISCKRRKNAMIKKSDKKANKVSFKVSLFDKKWFPPILNLVPIVLLSSAMIGMLYRHIYKDIINNPVLKGISQRMAGWPDFVKFLDGLLINIVFSPKIQPGRIILIVISVILLTAMAFHAYTFFRSIKQNKWRDRMVLNSPATFVFIITSLTLVLMFVQCVIMRKGLGLLRNHIFLTPLVVICAAVILDRFGLAFGQKIFGRTIRTFIAIAVVTIILHNWPSPHLISSQGMSGPLLRKLHALDSQKNWNIGFHKRAKNRMVGFWYYKRNFPQKYKCTLLETQKYKYPLTNYDVLVCTPKDRPKDEFWYKLNFFQNYAVLVNLSHLPKDKIEQLTADE